ncbi:hypothetical protein EKH80_17685 [Dyella choica]|uniref:Uncharacterized protein n=2 Tax=Dyella choica TaxID=1927959 RepID=A0A432M2J2_9GAMM|nr:hypothetical protein EKH80_17685 [Dyella choica]
MGFICFSSAALAGTPATGLGRASPHAHDWSTDPNWHVYVFVLNGITYLQVNDARNRVIGAVGTTGGQFITLPVGEFAQQVGTPQQPASMTSAIPMASPTTIYNDGKTQLTTTPMSDGTVTMQAASTQMMCDPVDCNIKGIAYQ